MLMRALGTMKTWVRLVEECAWLSCPMRVGDDGSRGHSYRPTRDCMDCGSGHDLHAEGTGVEGRYDAMHHAERA
jgi:hypothetical protein